MSSKTLFILAAVLGAGLLAYHFRDEFTGPFPAQGNPASAPPATGNGTTAGTANPANPIISVDDFGPIKIIDTSYFDDLKDLMRTNPT